MNSRYKHREFTLFIKDNEVKYKFFPFLHKIQEVREMKNSSKPILPEIKKNDYIVNVITEKCVKTIHSNELDSYIFLNFFFFITLVGFTKPEYTKKFIPVKN